MSELFGFLIVVGAALACIAAVLAFAAAVASGLGILLGEALWQFDHGRFTVFGRSGEFGSTVRTARIPSRSEDA